MEKIQNTSVRKQLVIISLRSLNPRRNLMARCSCYYEVGSDTIRRDTDPKCEVHGDKRIEA